MNPYQNTFQHAFDLWITPEVERRQATGSISKPYDLRAAQIIFFADDRPRQIRLNEEVRVIGRAKLKSGVSKQAGDAVYLHEIEGYDEFRLPDDEDPNCGHLTIYRIADQWTLSFDFRYNKGIARETIDAAKEFLDAAKDSLSRKSYRAFLDTAFSAAELTAKAFLVITPLPGETAKASHGRIHARYNMQAKMGNIKSDHKDAFNRLSAMRSPARYVDGKLRITHDEAVKLYDSVSDAIAFVEARIKP